MDISIHIAKREKLLPPSDSGAVLTNSERAEGHRLRMREYKAKQLSSVFQDLPEDLESLILNHSSDGVFGLGRTCKYWNLRVRDYVNQHPEGRKILRSQEEAAFSRNYQHSVVDACRAEKSCPSGETKYFQGASSRKACIDALIKSDLPVQVQLEEIESPLPHELKKALATRGGKLTLLNFFIDDQYDINLIKDAVEAIPRGGFVGLTIAPVLFCFYPIDMTPLWDAIAAHPVVAHIEFQGYQLPKNGELVLQWIAQLLRKDSKVSSFTLDRCRLEAQGSDAWKTLLARSTGITELEIREHELYAESVLAGTTQCEIPAIEPATNYLANLTDAVRARNATDDTKLTVYLSIGNLEQAIEASR